MFKGRKELQDVSRFSSDDIHEVIHTFRPVKSSDADRYKCVAKDANRTIIRGVKVKLIQHIHAITSWEYHENSELVNFYVKIHYLIL